MSEGTPSHCDEWKKTEKGSEKEDIGDGLEASNKKSITRTKDDSTKGKERTDAQRGLGKKADQAEEEAARRKAETPEETQQRRAAAAKRAVRKRQAAIWCC